MLKYRSRAKISAEILQATSKGASKTHIMYAACLSYSQMRGYLDFLVSRGLLRIDDDRHLYILTEKGLQFLHAFESMEKLIDDRLHPESSGVRKPRSRRPTEEDEPEAPEK